MTGFSSGYSSLPTWEYVQQVITANIGKSEDAIDVAYNHMAAIAVSYDALQHGNWDVDVGVGTDVDLQWPSGPSLIASVVEPTANDLPTDIVVRKTEAQVIDPGVAPIWDVPGSTVPEDIADANLTLVAALPAVPVINTSVPVMDVGAAAHGFTPTDAPEWAIDLSGSPTDIADAALSPVGALGTVPTIDAEVSALDVAKANNPDIPINPLLWDVDLSGLPNDLDALALSTVAQLNALPLIDVSIPTMDVALLDESFSFVEEAYVERVSTEIEANLQAVLGGEVGLPQGYWDLMWTEVSNDFARLQVSDLRNARNRGAASHWGLPTETVLVAAGKIQDEGARKLQTVRLEMVKQQAIMAREDYWQAITQGMAYEKIWVDQSDRVNQRALAAAEQAVGLSVQVQNANIARFNLSLEAAKLDGSIDDLKVKRLLSKHSQELQSNSMEIQQDKQKVERWIGEWQGHDIDSKLEISNLSERAKVWGIEIDARVKAAGLDLDTTKTNMDRYQGILEADKLDSTLDAMKVKRVLDTHTANLETNKVEIGADKSVLDRWLGKWDGYKTEKTLEVSTLAEETKAWGMELDGDVKLGGLNLDETKTNLSRHQESLSTAKLSLESDVARVKRVLESHSANMQTAQVETDRDKAVISRWLGEWQGYKIELDAQLAAATEEAKYWGIKVDGAARMSAQGVEEDKVAIQNYVAQLSKVDTVSRSISQLLTARVGQQEAEIKNQAQTFQSSAAINAASLNVAQLTQAAQETKAKLDIAQKEWVGGQGNALLNNMAQLAVGLAQSLITVSDVNLGSSASSSDSYSESASHNAEKVW